MPFFDILINAITGRMLNKALDSATPKVENFSGNPDEFIKAMWPHALKVQADTGLSALACVTQGSLEGGYGSKSPGGNSFFGIKADSNWTGTKIKATTTEHKRPTVPTSQIIKAGPPVWTISDWFRTYPSFGEAVADYGRFFVVNKRYAKVFLFNTPLEQLKEIARAGYSTNDAYFNLVKGVFNGIEKRVKKLGLSPAPPLSNSQN